MGTEFRGKFEDVWIGWNDEYRGYVAHATVLN